MSLLPEHDPKPVDTVTQLKLDMVYKTHRPIPVSPEVVAYTRELTAALLEQWEHSGFSMQPLCGDKRSRVAALKIPADFFLSPQDAADILVNEVLAAMGPDCVTKVTIWEALVVGGPPVSDSYKVVIRIGDVETS